MFYGSFFVAGILPSALLIQFAAFSCVYLAAPVRGPRCSERKQIARALKGLKARRMMIMEVP